jgi:hypothetical protein
MGHPAGIGMVIRLLQAALLLPRRRVGQRHPVVRLPQPINEPVPVIGGLDHHALEVGAIRGSWLQNRGQMSGEAALIAHLILRIE